MLTSIDDPIDVNALLTTTPARSATWMGWLCPPVTGPYRLHLDSPAAKIVLSNQNMSNGSAMDMVIGRFYHLVIEIVDTATISHNAKLEWTTSSGRCIIPKSLLYEPQQ